LAFEMQISINISVLKIAPKIARVFRVIRITRLIKLVEKYKGLESLLGVIKQALPSLISVLILLLIFLFIFAILGVYLFSKIKMGTAINEHTFNFKNLGFSLMTCIRMLSGENWPDLMIDTMRTSENGCIENYDCGNKFNWVFFVVFNLIMSYIILQLFILVILDEFD